MNKKILFLTLYDEGGASSRCMIYDYLKYFKKAGYGIRVMPLIRGRQVYRTLSGLSNARTTWHLATVLFQIAIRYLWRYVQVIQAWSYDLVIIQKDVLPFGLSSVLAFRQKNIIFHTDDPIWISHKGSGKQVPYWGEKLAQFRTRSLIRILKKALLVIVENHRMQSFVQEHNPNCIVLESGIALETTPPKKVEMELAIGWLGSPSTSHLLEELLPALERLAKEVPFKLYNIGGKELHARNFPIENIPWSLENEAIFIPRFAIGLMPMGNDVFNLTRTSRKWMNYGVYHVPTLAADTPLNRSCMEDGVTGFFYPMGNDEIFCKKAKTLLLDQILREKIGRNVYQKLLRDHTTDRVGEKFVSLVLRAAHGL